MAEWSAKNRINSVSPWGHYQPEETKEIKEYFKGRRKQMKNMKKKHIWSLTLVVSLLAFLVTPITARADYGNHSASTAALISDSLIGSTLVDDATDQENWYYFSVGGGEKITAILEQPTDGDYDIYLYKYTDSNLAFVAYSAYSGSVMDQLSYVADEDGYFFLRVVPSTASETAGDIYYFVVRLDSVFDTYEGNDNLYQAYSAFNNLMNVSATIDNIFDVDFYTFVVPNSENYRLSLNNVPSGAQYKAEIYDSSFNVVSSLLSTGNNNTLLNLNAGTYYVGVYSYNNQYDNAVNYKLEMYPIHSSSSTFYTTHGGHTVELTSSAVYIDGVAADLNWEFIYDINYTRIQRLTVTSSTTVDASTYQNGSFVDAQNINSSNDCIRVKINNFNYYYYCNNPYSSYTTNYGSTAYKYLYIDANTGQAVGTEVDYYLTLPGFHYTFNAY